MRDILVQQASLSVLGIILGTLTCFALYAGPVRNAELTRFASLELVDPHKLSIFGTIENIDKASRKLQLETTDPYDNSSIKISVTYDDRTRFLSHESLIATPQATLISEDTLPIAPVYANVVLRRDTEMHANTVILYCDSVACI